MHPPARADLEELADVGASQSLHGLAKVQSRLQPLAAVQGRRENREEEVPLHQNSIISRRAVRAPHRGLRDHVPR